MDSIVIMNYYLLISIATFVPGINRKIMSNHLFLICPLSFSEHYLIQNISGNHCFLTALGTTFRFEEIRYVEKINYFLESEKINCITIVHDLQSEIFRNIINHKKIKDGYFSEVILNHYLNHYKQINACSSQEEKSRELAIMHMQVLHDTITNHTILTETIDKKNIVVNGLMIDKTKGKKEFIDYLIFRNQPSIVK